MFNYFYMYFVSQMQTADTRFFSTAVNFYYATLISIIVIIFYCVHRDKENHCKQSNNVTPKARDDHPDRIVVSAHTT